MSEEDRSKFVETMKRAEGHVLFAVMGGIFSEEWICRVMHWYVL